MNTIHTICIVDDDEEIRSLLSDYLRRNGFSTCTAGNAAEFLEMQRRVPCSLIVMDIMLPGMNGLELFRTLRAESTVPVIFLTALGDITDRIVGLELGADDYLSKPFEPRELLARIRTVLRRTEGGARRDQPETTPLQFAGWLLDRSARHLVAPDGVVVSPERHGIPPAGDLFAEPPAGAQPRRAAGTHPGPQCRAPMTAASTCRSAACAPACATTAASPSSSRPSAATVTCWPRTCARSSCVRPCPWMPPIMPGK